MSRAKTTAVSGCLIWVLLVFFISSCTVPVFVMIGGVSSFSNFAIKTTGGWLCPEGTTPERYSYATTSRDSNGFETPATAYELHCVDAGGEVVKEDPVLYAFIWIGVISSIGLILGIILSFVFAVPGGMLVTRLLEKLRKPGMTGNN